ncbi:hypothetical protein T4E_9274 [Trichinella pseudospiralis]|uniref:Uncharacterized protein n=1 Tax=Trichinella pseudospiralis TaxID=6337 RepID=A0A0V0XPS1_TRIPS|nr:hypothetical protein T4E_9274 [Trichinella pseudospiralis]
MDKKRTAKITTAQKPQIIQSVDKNLNMKLSDIEQMMKIEKRKTLESPSNDGNSISRKQIQDRKFPELLLITFSPTQIK